MRRGIIPWDQLPHGIRRIVEPWLTPLPRRSYLRRGPLRAVLQRLAFVSRLEPKVAITVNVAPSVRLEPPAVRQFARVVVRGASPPRAGRQLPAVQAQPRPSPDRSRREAEVPFRAPGVLLVTRHRTTHSVTQRLAEQIVRVARVVQGRGPSVSPVSVVKPELVVRVARVVQGRGPSVSPVSVVKPELVVRLSRRVERQTEMTPATAVRVVRRGEAARTATTRAALLEMAGDAPAARSGPQGATGAWPAGLPAGQLPVNVDQITDEVVRQLDRRLIASRERLGRI